MMKFAKPEEIQHAHSVLLKDNPYFEQDKIDIIECNESQDIKACPGSGKTTTLLAKLIILANRMPLPDNQGICVLTHTNVAIDEIKNKLGHKYSNTQIISEQYSLSLINIWQFHISLLHTRKNLPKFPMMPISKI